jgi:glyoxylase-like metal-dependent hydrolase (beta-lactamase superfamily II)
MHVIEKVYVVGRGKWGEERPLSRGGGANIFLLDGGSELALFDGGMQPGIADVLANIRSLGFDPDRIRKLFITHTHSDHINGINELLKHIPMTVYGHALARETLADGPGIYVPEFKAAGLERTPVHELLKEGDKVKVGNAEIKVLEVPGHTPDGLAFTMKLNAGHTCIAGDTAIGDQPPAKGVIGWISSNWNSNLTHHTASLERLRALELSAFFPGHGYSHVTASACRTSLDNCLWRLEQLMAIPHLNTMMSVGL